MSGLSSRAGLVMLAGLAALVVSGFILLPFGLRIATLIVIAALWAASYNLVLGGSGLPSFGHGALYGLGAYSIAILMRDTQMSFLLALVVAGLVSTAGGIIMAGLGSRTTGLYFGILTLAVGQVYYIIAFQWYSLTGGDNGIFGVPIDYWLTDPRAYYFFTLGLATLLIVVLRQVARSPFGTVLMAVRDGDQRATFLGIPPKLVRIVAFAVSAFCTGIAGALYAGLDSMAFPGLLNWTNSARPLLMSLLGGIHDFGGPLVGAVLLVGLETFLGQVTDHLLIIMGILFIGIVLYMPEGLVGWSRRMVARR